MKGVLNIIDRCLRTLLSYISDEGSHLHSYTHHANYYFCGLRSAAYLQHLIKNKTTTSSTTVTRILKYIHYKQTKTINHETQPPYLLPPWCISLW